MGAGSDNCDCEIPQSAEAADAEEEGFLILNHLFFFNFFFQSLTGESLQVIISASRTFIISHIQYYLL